MKKLSFSIHKIINGKKKMVELIWVEPSFNINHNDIRRIFSNNISKIYWCFSVNELTGEVTNLINKRNTCRRVKIWYEPIESGVLSEKFKRLSIWDRIQILRSEN